MELSLPTKTYNHDKLKVELDESPVFKALMVRGNTYSVILADDATQEQMDAVTAIALAHDDSLTAGQLSRQAQLAIASQITRSKQSLYLVAPIWQVRATHLTGESDETALVCYAQILAVITSYWADKDNEQVQFVELILSRLCTQHFNISYSTPPDPVTTDYANKFLRAVYQLVDLINAQYKF